jgi:hypothetical protein
MLVIVFEAFVDSFYPYLRSHILSMLNGRKFQKLCKKSQKIYITAAVRIFENLCLPYFFRYTLKIYILENSTCDRYQFSS